MSLSLPFEVNGPQGDAIRAVVLGHSLFASVSTTFEGEPVYVLVARGAAVGTVKALLMATEPQEVSQPEVVNRDADIVAARKPVSVTTGTQDSAARTPSSAP